MEKVATLCPQKPACGFFLLEWAGRLQHSVHAAVAPGPMEWHCFLIYIYNIYIHIFIWLCLVWKCPYAPCMVYLPTFGWFLGQMLVNIPATWSIWDILFLNQFHPKQIGAPPWRFPCSWRWRVPEEFTHRKWAFKPLQATNYGDLMGFIGIYQWYGYGYICYIYMCIYIYIWLTY